MRRPPAPRGRRSAALPRDPLVPAAELNSTTASEPLLPVSRVTTSVCDRENIDVPPPNLIHEVVREAAQANSADIQTNQRADMWVLGYPLDGISQLHQETVIPPRSLQAQKADYFP